jgi:hypothetical protein
LVLIPLCEKLQRGVTRVVYGRWHEPYEVLASLGEQLEAAADIDRLLDAAVTELTTGLDLRDVSVRDLGGTTIASTWSTAADTRGPDPDAASTVLRSGLGPTGHQAGSLAPPRSGCCAIWPVSSAPRCMHGCCARTCSARGNAWCWPARKNGAGCAATCTTASAPRWPG